MSFSKALKESIDNLDAMEVLTGQGKSETTTKKTAPKTSQKKTPQSKSKRPATMKKKGAVAGAGAGVTITPPKKEEVETKTRRVQLVFTQSLYDSIKSLADAEDMSVNGYISTLLENFVESVR